jgi:hypothetical protein
MNSVMMPNSRVISVRPYLRPTFRRSKIFAKHWNWNGNYDKRPPIRLKQPTRHSSRKSPPNSMLSKWRKNVSSMLKCKRYILPSVLFDRLLIRQAQLQARTRECQKWQHLALTQDRNAYRNYTRSKPTNGVDSKSVTGAGTSTPKIWIKSTEASPEHEDLQTPGRVGRQG